MLHRLCGLWRETPSGRYKQTSVRGLERTGISYFRGPGPCADSYPSPLQRLPRPRGFRELTSMRHFCPCSPCPNPSIPQRLGQVPHSPSRCWDPRQEKNVYLKADSSKGMGGGRSLASKALPQGTAAICLQKECLLPPSQPALLKALPGALALASKGGSH